MHPLAFDSHSNGHFRTRVVKMNNMSLIILAIFTTILFSGCTENSEQPTKIAEIRTSFLMEGCTIGGSSSQLPTTSSSTISGWSSAFFDAPIVEFGFCESITTPNSTQEEVSYALIKSSPQTPPEECKIHPENNMKILQWFVSDNAEIVEYLKSMGAPAEEGKILSSLKPTGVPSAQVSWTSQSGDGKLENLASELQFIEYEVGRNLAWQNGEKVMVWSQVLKTQLSAEFHNPMRGTTDVTLPGAPVSGNWIGTTEFYLNANYSGRIHEFADSTCQTFDNRRSK